MTTKNIKLSHKTVAHKTGFKTYYTVRVFDEQGEIGAESTSDYQEAKENYNQALETHPSATINGSDRKSVDPFKDGTMPPPLTAGSENLGITELEQPALLSSSPADVGDQLAKFNSMSLGVGELNAPGVPSSTTKLAEDLSGLSPEIKNDILNLDRETRAKLLIDGVANSSRTEPRVNHCSTGAEKVIRSPFGNAFCILGKDRIGHEITGYGGTGDTQCDAIHLVAGMGGAKPKQADSDGNLYYTNPNFFIDSAMIYMSQKTDVDAAFAIGREEHYENSQAKSAVVVKADNIRIVGRESLRLVTNTDSRNSQSGKLYGWSGIWLMANNDEDGLQPIPRGDNLIDALDAMNENIKKLTKFFYGYIRYQQKFNRALATHQHFSPFFAIETTPSKDLPPESIENAISVMSKTQMSILSSLTNLTGWKNNFLLPHGQSTKKPNASYINSRFNKTN